MKTSDYLYDNLNIRVLEKQEYVCLSKIKSAKKLLSKLLEPPLGSRDEERINAVINAIDFNEKLLKDTEYMIDRKDKCGKDKI